jgi:hypothetical protein
MERTFIAIGLHDAISTRSRVVEFTSIALHQLDSHFEAVRG